MKLILRVFLSVIIAVLCLPVFSFLPVSAEDTGTLEITKYVSGGLTGTFNFTVSGTGGTHSASVTVDEGENSDSVTISIPPGVYSIVEADSPEFVCTDPEDNQRSATVADHK